MAISGFSVVGTQPAAQHINDALAGLVKSGIRLSSGNRLTQVSDDIASYATGVGLENQTIGLTNSLSAIQKLSGVLEEADKALSTVSELYLRQKQVAVQANSGALTDNERAFLEAERQQLAKETDRVIANASFGGAKLFDKSRFNNDAIVKAQGLGAFSLIDILAQNFRDALTGLLKTSY